MDEKCILIRDLLPLHLEGLCSEEASAIVENHLTECAECQDICDSMRENAVPSAPGKEAAKQVIKPFKKVKMRYVRGALIAVLVVFVLLYPATLTVNEVRGKGVSFTSIFVAGHAQKAIEGLMEQNWGQAEKYLVLPKGRAAFESGLDSLYSEGFAIESFHAYPFDVQKDEGLYGGTTGMVFLDGEEWYFLNYYYVEEKGKIRLVGAIQLYGPENSVGESFLLERDEWPQVENIQTFPDVLLGTP